MTDFRLTTEQMDVKSICERFETGFYADPSRKDLERICVAYLELVKLHEDLLDSLNAGVAKLEDTEYQLGDVVSILRGVLE